MATQQRRTPVYRDTSWQEPTSNCGGRLGLVESKILRALIRRNSAVFLASIENKEVYEIHFRQYCEQASVKVVAADFAWEPRDRLKRGDP